MRKLRSEMSEGEKSKTREQNSERKKATYDPVVSKARVAEQRKDAGFCFYYDRVQKYGLSIIGYLTILSQQGGKCAICRSETAGGKGTWHIDHDHRTNRVRGLLCHYCNTALGSFKDSRALLTSASNYLKIQ